jgi:2-iminobutanoate/2-iminopropanoate deaminase
MASDRTRIAALAAVVGVGLGIAGTLIVYRPESVSAQSSARRVIRPERAPNTGLPYSSGIMVGNTLYIAGHLGRDPVTSQLAKGGIEAETRQSIANIGEVLKAAGMSFRDVTTVTVYITDFKEFDRFNAVYREYFPTDPPARATVQVAALNAGARVELQMIAARP